MKYKLNEILRHILESLGEDGLDDFQDKFNLVVYSRTIKSLMEKLPTDTRSELEKEIKNIQTPEAKIQLFLKAFPQHTIEEEFQSAAEAELLSFVEALAPRLSIDQKKEIQQYIDSLN